MLCTSRKVTVTVTFLYLAVANGHPDHDDLDRQLPTYVPRVSISTKERYPGFSGAFPRVWTATAYDDSKNIIAQVFRTRADFNRGSSNRAKLLEFAEELSRRGYTLTEEQIEEISEMLPKQPQ